MLRSQQSRSAEIGGGVLGDSFFWRSFPEFCGMGREPDVQAYERLGYLELGRNGAPDHFILW
jgi:hypothetical protein